MRKIAVTQRLLENESYKELREALDVRYSQMLFAAGFLPIILPYGVDFKNYFAECSVDGILLTGGNDLSSVNKSMLSAKRDEYEYELIKFAVENNVPLFGICRGLQIIAEYFGSTLKCVTGSIATRGALTVNKDSKYVHELSGLDDVNSYHAFAVDTVGADLLVSAVSETGIVKAIEHKKHNIFAQMWHSEREDPFADKELALIRSFFDKSSPQIRTGV